MHEPKSGQKTRTREKSELRKTAMWCWDSRLMISTNKNLNFQFYV